MNSQWKAFLESHSATIDEDGMTRFAGGSEMPADALCDLSYLGLIKVSGEDAAEFLQGQFTNDIHALGDDSYQLSGFCNPKGRMFANFWVFKRDGDIYLQMPHETLVPTLKRLSMFVLRSKVTLVDASDELVCIGAMGKQIETLLPALPNHSQRLVQHEGLTIICQPGETPRYKIIGEVERVQVLWEQLAKQATPADTAYWRLLDIHAGIPSIYATTAEAFIPQMVNMQLVDGVSFTKGCYCGQEIVARTQYRGTLKRRMHLAHLEGNLQPMPGDVLYSASTEHDQTTGLIVDAQPSPKGGHDALVMVQIACVEANDVHLGDSSGPKLNFGELPYGFEKDEE